MTDIMGMEDFNHIRITYLEKRQLGMWPCLARRKLRAELRQQRWVMWLENWLYTGIEKLSEYSENFEHQISQWWKKHKYKNGEGENKSQSIRLKL